MVQLFFGGVSRGVSRGVSGGVMRNISLRARPANTLTYPWPRTIRGSPTRRSSLNPKIIIFWEKNVRIHAYFLDDVHVLHFSVKNVKNVKSVNDGSAIATNRL